MVTNLGDWAWTVVYLCDGASACVSAGRICVAQDSSETSVQECIHGTKGMDELVMVRMKKEHQPFSGPILVLSQPSNDGYSFLSLIRAPGVLNRQVTFASLAFRSASQAATSRVSSSALSMRRSKH